jgi:3-hydroxy-9,10-secoandrosta-1,3,5(10)-triene-9,17-dione monooxygenase reductase component
MRAGLHPTDSNFKHVLGHFATGVAVITAIKDGPVGLTVQAMCSLSLEPPLILVCPGKSSTTWPHIVTTGKLCINLLADDQSHLARQFAKPGANKYEGVGWHPSECLGLPVIDGALAWIDCEIADTFAGGDHWIAVCRVLALEAQVGVRPLIFCEGTFGTVLPLP